MPGLGCTLASAMQPIRSVIPLLACLLAAGCGQDVDGAAKELRAVLQAAEAGPVAGASDRIRQAVARAPDDAGVRTLAARAGMALGLSAEALGHAREAWVRGPNRERRRLLAEGLLRIGKPDDGGDEAEAVLAEEPQDRAARATAGVAWVPAGWVEEAVRAAEDLRRLAPGDPSARARVGFVLVRAGRGVEAKGMVSDLAPAGLEDPYDLSLLGTTLYELQAGAGAVAAFERALQKVPEDPDLLFNLGAARLLGDDFRAAKDAYDRILARNPEDAKALGQVAYCMFRMGRLESAIATIRKARAADPDDKVLEMLEAEIGRGPGP